MSKFLGRSFEVRDAAGRSWGFVTLNRLFRDTFSGRLQPSNQFEEVAPLFQSHDAWIAQEREDGSGNLSQEISALGVHLVPKGEKQVFDTSVAFVSAQFLFTCNMPVERTVPIEN